ncbi:hypothetical protein NIES2111_02180 [Nostoc sp. NIES-2111]|nr:hypothetical protein NIES2111_02180 [Nostoc sp. NIES-2111]
MKAKNLLFSTGLALSAVVGVSSTAQAAIFTTNFTPDSPDPKEDIFLQFVTQNGRDSISFNFVESVNIISNTGLTIGGTSTDRGDNASNPPGGGDPAQFPSNEQLAAYLGNNNLNNIADTEDDGEFVIDLTFEDVIAADPEGTNDSLFFWERGFNSDITVQALDAEGNTIGNAFTITRALFALSPAGYSIDTTEIGGAQEVGSYGVSFDDLDLASDVTFSKIRLTALQGFNGPDIKVVAANFTAPPEDIPEPATIIGLGSVAALALVRRRQLKKGLS